MKLHGKKVLDLVYEVRELEKKRKCFGKPSPKKKDYFDLIETCLKGFEKMQWIELPYNVESCHPISRWYSAKLTGHDTIIFEESVRYTPLNLHNQKTKIIAKIIYKINTLRFDVDDGYSESLYLAMNSFFGTYVKDIDAVKRKIELYGEKGD